MKFTALIVALFVTSSSYAIIRDFTKEDTIVSPAITYQNSHQSAILIGSVCTQGPVPVYDTLIWLGDTTIGQYSYGKINSDYHEVGIRTDSITGKTYCYPFNQIGVPDAGYDISFSTDVSLGDTIKLYDEHFSTSSGYIGMDSSYYVVSAVDSFTSPDSTVVKDVTLTGVFVPGTNTESADLVIVRSGWGVLDYHNFEMCFDLHCSESTKWEATADTVLHPSIPICDIQVILSDGNPKANYTAQKVNVNWIDGQITIDSQRYNFITVYNISGQEVFSASISGGTVHAGNIKEGVYFIQLYGENSISQLKIFKQ